ncbi:unnamed protein product [marine sediment metagenome]|uniref:Uncharacterized protein n=1 Tax=marine sediment metagenome TaxID=412755 RepID=X0SV74_9ZZZZ
MSKVVTKESVIGIYALLLPLYVAYGAVWIVKKCKDWWPK